MMTGACSVRRVTALRVLAVNALLHPTIGESHDLLGAVGNLHPLELLELADAWLDRAGVVRRADVTDVQEVQ